MRDSNLAISNLLNQVDIINQKNEEIQDATGARFNMFRLCGVNHYENTHSAILAEFLNPKGSHGLRHKLLESFIDSIGMDFSLRDFNCSDARVNTEFQTDDGRIDIFIEDDQKNAIIIENKVYAVDQHEQLKRYSEFAKSRNLTFQIFYLTLNGENASEQSAAGVSYSPISYRRTIINWLEQGVAISARVPIVRETLVQYINHLKILTNQDMDVKNKEEVTALISKVENLRAAKAIHQNYAAAFDLLAKQYFNPKMEEFAQENELQFIYRNSDEYSINFSVKKEIWQDKYDMRFVLDGHYCFGLFCCLSNEFSLSNEKKNELKNKASKISGETGKSTDCYPYYINLGRLSLEKWEKDIIYSDNFIRDCQKRILNLLEAMKELDL